MQHKILIPKLALTLAHILEAQRTQRLFETIGARLDHQDVVRFDLGDARKARQATSATNQANDLDIDFRR